MNMREMVNERQKEQKKKTEEQRTKNKEQRAKRKALRRKEKKRNRQTHKSGFLPQDPLLCIFHKPIP